MQHNTGLLEHKSDFSQPDTGFFKDETGCTEIFEEADTESFGFLALLEGAVLLERRKAREVKDCPGLATLAQVTHNDTIEYGLDPALLR